MALSTHERGEGGTGTDRRLLVLDELTIAYGRIRAVDDVSLSIPADGCTAILGPNGAGKTTILRGITGLVRAQSGHVHLDGVDITRMRPFRIARLGVAHVQQGRGIFPRLTVDENIRAVAAGLDDVDVDRSSSTSPAWASGAGRWPAPCPAASSRCWPSAWRSSAGPASWWSTSRRWASPRRSSARSTTCSPACGSRAPPSSSSSSSCTCSSVSPTRCSSSRRAGWRSPARPRRWPGAPKAPAT